MFAKTMSAVTVLFMIASTAVADTGPDPYTMADETWIGISGTIASPTDDSFLLDYGEGVVTVEMDDWDSYGEARALIDGDRVTVSGKVDSGLYESTTIEASSVYVENLNTYFFASAADEESDTLPALLMPTPLVVTATANIRGKVSSLDPATRTFTIETGDRELTVNTWSLGYNPLDEHGYQQISEGDLVLVTGRLDAGFFGDRELDADAVITLRDDSDS